MGYFRKIFIANRGEIACRAIRPARELGIPVVVGYSDCDALSLHVKLADEAVRLGPSPATMSYLDIEAVLRAAKDSGCDAIFPGYGFLAENPDFADAVDREGLVFIGPSARVMRILGDKIAARKALSASGVPVTPAIEDVGSAEQVIRFGDRVGWPILIKAAAYARGKGIVIADTKFELGTADGELILIDEALTPDSSRFWPAAGYAPGGPQKSFDKQFVRDYLLTLPWNKTAPGPRLPAEVIEKTALKYREALKILTGNDIE